MSVEFIDIKEFEDLYSISKEGIVLSKKNKKGNIDDGYYLKPFERNGYLSVCLNKNKRKHFKNIHRLVAETFLENLENKSQVNHKDGDKHNNKLENLEWVTPSENIFHAHKLGLIPKLKHTEEHKIKMSNIAKNKLKKVSCLTDGISFINIYDASVFYKIKWQSIQAVCLGKRNSVFNKIFQYMEN